MRMGKGWVMEQEKPGSNLGYGRAVCVRVSATLNALIPNDRFVSYSVTICFLRLSSSLWRHHA